MARDEVDESWHYFQRLDLSALSPADLAGLSAGPRATTSARIEIHFEVMYPMLANFLGFYGACAELGLDPSQIGKFLQGEDTKIMEPDRELYELTRSGPRRRPGARLRRARARASCAPRSPRTAVPRRSG